MEFYGEALCPYCANFTATQLSAMFKNGVSELMHLSYVAWGNARVDDNTGEASCCPNTVECPTTLAHHSSPTAVPSLRRCTPSYCFPLQFIPSLLHPPKLLTHPSPGNKCR